ncbi:ATP-binding protein [Paracoccus sp. JM45]|uniref:ATP-binding protein n=1 Tax=Paracoccus sp. JM45 TaxID=2283626 RepID=UPI000E6C54AF|nr:ATP-binding protein [Paracoccus sp. JM45]RJE79401.1 ATP-binding protein [Paracoccus sp. JM45]
MRLKAVVPPKTQPMFHRVLDADPVVVRATLTDMRHRFARDVCDDTLGRLELVMAELMNNVAEHAPVATSDRLPVIHLCIVRHQAGLACALADDGVSLPDACMLPRSLPPAIADNLPEGGFGWFLVQNLTQALCYYRASSRNYLAFNIPFMEREDENLS